MTVRQTFVIVGASLAGAKAAWQLLFKPSYWEKTTHGLYLPAPAKEAADAG